MNYRVGFGETYIDWIIVLVVAVISNAVMVGGLIFMFKTIITKKLNDFAKLVK